jgi:molybdopterin converting factor small subunit
MQDERELRDLMPEPAEEWQRLLRFVGWSGRDRAAAARTGEALLRHAHPIVVEAYNHLAQVPETAAILGWEHRVDDAHLAERRRFFTLWVARAIGLDTSDEFAHYLFHAGKAHAGHGPRQIHTPPAYVTASVGLVQAAFAGAMEQEGLRADVIAAAMAAWSKYFSVQLNQMLLGYRAAQEFRSGALAVRCTLFGRLRPLVGKQALEIRVASDASVGDAARKFFNYFPQVRSEALERVWYGQERADALWMEVAPAYVPRYGWRILLNGREVSYTGGFAAPIRAGDELALFPPGR